MIRKCLILHTLISHTDVLYITVEQFKDSFFLSFALQIIQSLSKITHYPVGGREMTEVLEGLHGKYRSMIFSLQRELYLTSKVGSTYSSESHPESGDRRQGNKGRYRHQENKSDIDVFRSDLIHRSFSGIGSEGGTDSSGGGYDSRSHINAKDVEMRRIYEKLLSELDGRSRGDFQTELSNAEREFKSILDLVDSDHARAAAVREQEYSMLLMDAMREGHVANEDRCKLLKISEVLHSKYSAAVKENETLAVELSLAGVYVCSTFNAKRHMHSFV